jgi:hypothetical protein
MDSQEAVRGSGALSRPVWAHVHIVSIDSTWHAQPGSAADMHTLFKAARDDAPGFSVMVRLTRARQRAPGGA